MVAKRSPEEGGLDSTQRGAPSPYTSISRQLRACFSAMITMSIVGAVDGWTITQRYHTGETGNMPLTITQDQYSRTVSLTVFGSMIGAIVGAVLADCRGRKFCLLLCSTIFTLGWVIIYTATSLQNLYFARVFLGIAVGIAHTINPMYVSEVANNNMRGALAAIIVVSLYIGSTLISILGFWRVYKSLLTVLIILSFISLLSNMCFPETPYFLVAKGRKKLAQKSISYYRATEDPEKIKFEIRVLREQTRYELHPQSRYELREQSRSDSILSSRDDFTSQSGGSILSQSIREGRSDSIRNVDTETMSDLQFPSTRHSSSQSIFVIHSEVTREVHPQTIGELRQQSSRELHVSSPVRVRSPTKEIRRSSASQIQQAPTGETRRASTSQIHRSPTSETRRPSTVKMPQLSEMQSDAARKTNPRTRSKLHSRTRTNSRKQSSTDSRESPDIDEIHMGGTKCTWLYKLQAVLQRSNRKALFIIFVLIMTQQLNGNVTTMQYLETLLKETRVVMYQYHATILAMVVRLVSGILTILSIDLLRRRTLLILSTLGSCFTLIIIATYLLLVEYKFDVSIFSTLLIIDLIVYQVMFQIGLGTLPTVLLCELFPPELNGIVGAITVIFDGIIGFIMLKLYQLITVNVGPYTIYFIFAISCGLAFLMVFAWLPETRGKTYDEIQELLLGRSSNSFNEERRNYEMDILRI